MNTEELEYDLELLRATVEKLSVRVHLMEQHSQYCESPRFGPTRLQDPMKGESVDEPTLAECVAACFGSANGSPETQSKEAEVKAFRDSLRYEIQAVHRATGQVIVLGWGQRADAFLDPVTWGAYQDRAAEYDRRAVDRWADTRDPAKLCQLREDLDGDT